MTSVNGDQLRDVAERLVKTYPEDLNTSFPKEIVHFQEYMGEPQSDMRQSEKGENKGTFIALRMFQTMKCNFSKHVHLFMHLLVTSHHKLFWREFFFCSETY